MTQIGKSGGEAKRSSRQLIIQLGKKMNEDESSVDLVAKAAAQNGVSPIVLEKLLALESAFINFTSYGAKADFSRRVAHILDEATGRSSL